MTKCKDGNHGYAQYDCPNCGTDFCYDCCGAQNVDVADKYGQEEYMYCPECGWDVYDKEFNEKYVVLLDALTDEQKASLIECLTTTTI